MTIDLLTPGHEGRMQILLALTGIVRHHTAIGDDNLQISGVDPNAAEQVALSFFDLFGADIKDVAVDLVNLLTADVLYVVGANVFCRKDERITALDVLEVGGG